MALSGLNRHDRSTRTRSLVLGRSPSSDLPRKFIHLVEESLAMLTGLTRRDQKRRRNEAARVLEHLLFIDGAAQVRKFVLGHDSSRE
jgi:hypothetical protein